MPLPPHGEPQQLGVEILAVHRPHVAAREHDLDPTLARRLGDDVDRRRLQLDEEDLRVHALQLGAQPLAVGERARDVDDVGAVLLAGAPRDGVAAGRRREERDLAAGDVRSRPRPQRRRDDRGRQRERAACSSSQPVPGSAMVRITRSETRCLYSFR